MPPEGRLFVAMNWPATSADSGRELREPYRNFRLAMLMV
jgi:hypothetical protein